MKYVHKGPDDSSHSREEWITMVSLLEAYRTNELEDEQRQHIMAHVESCSMCQNFLIDMQEIAGAYAKVASLYPKHTTAAYADPQLAENIMTKILASSDEKQQQLRSPAKNRMFKKQSGQRGRRRLITLAACTLAGVAILIVGLILNFQRGSALQQGSQGTAIAIPYALQAGQTYISTSQNVFEIKSVVINTQEILFVYATTHHAHYGIGVQAMSAIQTQSSHDLPLHSSIQQFGQLGKYDTGVIHVQNLNKVGQIIQLKITFPGPSAATGTLQPVIQGSNNSTIRDGYTTLGVQSVKIPDVQLEGPLRPALDYIKGPNEAYIYLKITAGGNFQVITKEEYLKAPK